LKFDLSCVRAKADLVVVAQTGPVYGLPVEVCSMTAAVLNPPLTVPSRHDEVEAADHLMREGNVCGVGPSDESTAGLELMHKERPVIDGKGQECHGVASPPFLSLNVHGETSSSFIMRKSSLLSKEIIPW